MSTPFRLVPAPRDNWYAHPTGVLPIDWASPLAKQVCAHVLAPFQVGRYLRPQRAIDAFLDQVLDSVASRREWKTATAVIGLLARLGVPMIDVLSFAHNLIALHELYVVSFHSWFGLALDSILAIDPVWRKHPARWIAARADRAFHERQWDRAVDLYATALAYPPPHCWSFLHREQPNAPSAMEFFESQYHLTPLQQTKFAEAKQYVREGRRWD